MRALPAAVNSKKPSALPDTVISQPVRRRMPFLCVHRESRGNGYRLLYPVPLGSYRIRSPSGPSCRREPAFFAPATGCCKRKGISTLPRSGPGSPACAEGKAPEDSPPRRQSSSASCLSSSASGDSLPSSYLLTDACVVFRSAASFTWLILLSRRSCLILFKFTPHENNIPNGCNLYSYII